MIYVGSSFYKSAWTALLHRTSNMDTLIALGASVAYLYSLIYFVGGLAHLWPRAMGDELYFMESSALLALISLGHWLEARARKSAGSRHIRRTIKPRGRLTAIVLGDCWHPIKRKRYHCRICMSASAC